MPVNNGSARKRDAVDEQPETPLELSCGQFGCNARIESFNKREEAVQVTCEDGHVTSSTFGSKAGSKKEDDEDEAEHLDVEAEDDDVEGWSKGPCDEIDVRPSEDGWDDSRPQGSSSFAGHQVVDPSAYLAEEK